MNKTNGVGDTASVSTSLYLKEHNCGQRSSSAFPTFLKWFKKNEKRQKAINGLVSSHSSKLTDSPEALSPPSSPFLGNISPSSSCDSVLSTSTTGFAFIKPQYYRPYNYAEEPKLLFTDNPQTETPRRRENKYNCYNIENRQLSLREKYFLYDTDTITSNEIESGYDNIRYLDRSLPNAKKKTSKNNNQSIRNRRPHRRTVSDCSKDKKSGAYVHVKGKRKAPPPPQLALHRSQARHEYFYEDVKTERVSSHSEIYSSGSTLGRKKRKAPPPPPQSPTSLLDEGSKSILSEGLLDDKEIQAIIEGASTGYNIGNSTEKNCKMFSKRTSMKSSGKQDHPMDESKGVSNENLSSTSNHQETESPNRSPISAISPRPWYKRPISTNRESSIPFKREIVLKTMEKRKNKLKEKEAVSSLLPEVGYSRSSMFDSGYKFGFFSRNKDNSDENKSKDKEKRRSGIGIPNISELDREAAEIVNKEHAHEKAKERAEQQKFFPPPEHLLLQQQMFASKGQNQLASETENAIQVVSTKDLISKFESSSNAARVTLNTSFIGRTDNFFQNKAHDVKIIENNLHTVSSDPDIVRNKSVAEISKSPSIFSSIELTQDTKIEERQNMAGNGEAKVDKQAQSSMSSTTWSCPFCTLENPNWRIICEVCERLKPFDKLGKEGSKPIAKLSAKIDPLPNPQKNNIDVKIKSTPQSAQNIVEKVDNVNLKLLLNESNDWEKKADRVMKYFMPRNNSIGLSKSASETAVVKKPPVSRKSPSPSKVPICSPNFSRRSKMQRKEEKSKSNNDIKNSDAIHEKEANFGEKEQKKPLLDSSVIVTTITPVFYATTTAMTQPEVIKKDEDDTKKSSVDLKEVRSARLAKFSAKPQDQILSINEMSTQSLEEQNLLNNDSDSLEREKMRLREKIRAMNAKAFAEKYPVLQNKSTQDNTQLNSNLNEKIEESISKSVREGDSTKRGAIKKVLNKNLSLDCSTPDEIQENPITHDILANISKPKKISTSAQTTGFVKKFNETRSHSRELLSENSNEIKLDNVVHSIDVLSEIPATQPLQPYIKNFSEHEKARVEEISQQLQSLEGISNFKATLRNPLKGISWTDTMALNKIMRSLELAIAEGQDELAAKIAMDLAKMKVSLQVTKVKNRPTSGSIDYNQSIIVDLLVEDKISQKGPIQILVKPLMTILELKEKALKDFEIPIELQKWLINDEPATDNNKILLEYGVRDCTSGFYLYLITPDEKFSDKKEIPLPIPKTSIAIHEDLDGNLSDASSDSHNELETNDAIEFVQGAAALPFLENSILKSQSKCWQCPLCTLINSADVLACCACSKAKPHSTNFVLPYEDKYNMSEELRQFLEGNNISVQYRISEQKNDLNKINPNRKSSEIFNIVADQKKAQPTVLLERISPDGFKGALNSPSPNITKNRYRGVDNYNPNRQNGNGVLVTANRIPTPIKKEKPRAPAPPANTKTNHYLELLQLDNSDVVSNKLSFECPVCFMQFQKGEGIVLRDCLHSFCKECLSNTVRYSEEAEVKCPYMDAEYSCDSILQQREIKAIVTKEIYEQHLAKSIRVAEHQIENAFHCKTPNCRGWCIYEDNVNEFKCPVCRITNCLLCRVIHDGLTCKQFQDRLNSDCDSNLEARRTKDMIKEMVEKGEAMNCPTCQVIMMKKWGCDWFRCSMCKTEVCWVTRGPRWGPGGKGDTSGGCKCGVDGKKCHPKCNYCH